MRKMRSVGKIVRMRRETLGLSQQDAAWLAGVAKSTLRNIEGDRVEEARTWGRIERIYGWAPGSLELIRVGSEPQEILPVQTLRIFIRAIMRRRSLERENLDEYANIRAEIASLEIQAKRALEGGITSLEDAEMTEQLRGAISALEDRLRLVNAERNRLRQDTLRLKDSYVQILGNLLKREFASRRLKCAWLNEAVSDIYGVVSSVEAGLAAVGLGEALGVGNSEEILAGVYSREGVRVGQNWQDARQPEGDVEGDRESLGVDPEGQQSVTPYGSARVTISLPRALRGVLQGDDVLQVGAPDASSSADEANVWVIIFPLPAEVSSGLDDDDVNWLSDSLRQRGADMARGIVDAKKRERARQFNEIQDELPGIIESKPKKG